MANLEDYRPGYGILEENCANYKKRNEVNNLQSEVEALELFWEYDTDDNMQLNIAELFLLYQAEYEEEGDP